jgi:predicted transcriptional regulator
MRGARRRIYRHCQSEPINTGVIETGTIEADLVYIDQAKHEVGVLLNPSGGVYITFRCGGELVEGRGPFLAPVGPLNTQTTSFTASLSRSGAVQTPNEYENAIGEKRKAVPMGEWEGHLLAKGRHRCRNRSQAARRRGAGTRKPRRRRPQGGSRKRKPRQNSSSAPACCPMDSPTENHRGDGMDSALRRHLGPTVHHDCIPESDDVSLYIMHRTQIYLDDDQTVRLDRRAAAEGATRSLVIRRAVDEYLTRGEQDASAWQRQWRRAVEETAGIAPRLDDGAEYVEGLRRGDAERLSELER